jgi:hypothetical protein
MLSRLHPKNWHLKNWDVVMKEPSKKKFFLIGIVLTLALLGGALTAGLLLTGLLMFAVAIPLLITGLIAGFLTTVETSVSTEKPQAPSVLAPVIPE